MVPPVPELQPPATAERETRGRIFLSTEWRDLLMLNYEIDPALLQPFVPRGTELDSFEGTTYVSLVGLRFARTKLFGLISVPFHSDFDEVNLRIYVRRCEGSEIRRGVMFIREIVSLPAVTFLARLAYAENYRTLPLRHSINLTDSGGSIEYSWESASAAVSHPRANARHFISRRRRQPRTIHLRTLLGLFAPPQRQLPRISRRSRADGRIWRASSAAFEGDGAALYGSDFGSVLSQPPRSAFIADGSAVLVYAARRID